MVFADDQYEYANLIELLGRASLPTGQTLSQALTLEGVPFWDVFSPELAWRHLTTAVASTTLLKNAKIWIKPPVLHARDLVRSLAYIRRDDSDCSRWPEKPTVLCMGFTPRMYRDVLEPVAHYVAAHSDGGIVVLGSNPTRFSERGTTTAQIRHHVIWQHWGSDAHHRRERLNHSYRLLKRDLASASLLSSLLPGLSHEMLAAVRKMFGLFLKAYLPQIIPQAAIALHILTNHRPALVLSSDTSDARARLYTLIAKQMGIPTMEVQFGLIGNEAIEYRFFSADCIAAWGQDADAALLHQQVPGEKILQTGSPRHDVLVCPPEEMISHQRALLGLAGDSRSIVLLASTYVDRSHDEYVGPGVLLDMKRAIFEAAKATPGIVLVVKPHPHEDTGATRALAGRIPNIVFVDKESDIRNLIVMSDAFISFGSTATIDALIANKPTVCPIFPGWPFSENFRNSGAVWIPETSEEIRHLFSRIADDKSLTVDEEKKPARIRYLSRIVCQLDDLAAKRVGEKVILMAKL